MDPGLLKVAPYFYNALEHRERMALRATCREARLVVDSTVTAVHVAEHSAATVSARVAVTLGLLSRGARPNKLVLHPYVWDANGFAEIHLQHTTALTVLAAFAALHQPPAGPATTRPCLTHLSLCHVPYTDILASAVHAAAPNLSSLDIASDLSLIGSLAAATPGLCRLISTCAPYLTSLTFSNAQHDIPQPLAAAIATCTRLQHLQVVLYTGFQVPEDPPGSPEPQPAPKGSPVQPESAVRLAQALHSLPTLCSLDIALYGDAGRLSLDALSTLTQLTILKMDWTYDSTLQVHHLLPVLSPLRHLSRLTLALQPGTPFQVHGLAATCPQLTCLCVRREGTMPGHVLGPRRRGTVPLPPALRELHLDLEVKPRQLLELLLHPGLTRLTVAALHCSTPEGYYEDEGADSDGGGGGGGDGGGAPATPCPRFNELLEAVRLLCEHSGGGACEGLTLRHEWEPSPRTWPLEAGDGHVRLFAALRPLRLRKLQLANSVLEFSDVMALVEQLPELEELALHCQLHPAAVPLLARLPRLRRLTLYLLLDVMTGPLCCGPDPWLNPECTAAAVLPLLMGAPRLRYVELATSVGDNETPLTNQVTDEAVTEGVRWLRDTLRQMGRGSPTVEFGLEELVGWAEIR